jgi:hypothetical protein
LNLFFVFDNNNCHCVRVTLLVVELRVSKQQGERRGQRQRQTGWKKQKKKRRKEEKKKKKKKKKKTKIPGSGYLSC